ncbi:MAG: GTPase Era [Bacteroidetes bacterium]|jgi:GTP-binding protein Era|nr:GTPase Era [Bacteroidota bacterium]NBY29371.1 GTPase Era [Sphingobacteriia bacterium]NDC72587.1 GTPase Era [Sphingobacteriia bacterium]
MNPTTSDFQPGPEFKAGFINLLGKPNAGKSSLLNALVGEPLSIVTPKAQTTRSRCLGMLQSETYQLIIGDTPGYLEARYALQRLMSRSIDLALEDADALVWVADMRDDPDQELFLPTLLPTSLPLILLLNQADLLDKEGRQTQKERWMNRFQGLPCLEVSCVTKEGVDAVKAWMLDVLPVHPPYFDPDQLTDLTDRLMASEWVREQIFLHYHQEIPYACHVVTESFKEEAKIIRIEATIYVERDTQKGIVIGNKGSALKVVGTKARQQMEKFWGRPVYLGLHVKVRNDWRDDPRMLKYFGYTSD